MSDLHLIPVELSYLTNAINIWGQIRRNSWCMGPYLSLFICITPESNTFTISNSLPESTLTLCQSRLYPPVRDFDFGLWILGHLRKYRARISKLLRSPRIYSKEPIPPGYVAWRARAGIFKKPMGARHRGGIGFSYRPARLHRLAEFIPWNQCRGPINI